ncbi:hypothetical protein WJX82_001501 [Trebouxia sp. C0006]
MSGNASSSILRCIHNYEALAHKRRRKEAAHTASSRASVEASFVESKLVDTTAAAHSDQATADHSSTAVPSLTVTKPPLPSNVKASNFYGSNRLLLIDQRVARLCTNAQRRLLCQDSAPFERFSLQRQAFAWAEAHELAADLKTFSVEHDSTGRRSFLVSTHDGFWKRYQDMLPDHRHYYEIIQESCSCHLYFDLEFQKAFNTNVNGQSMVDHLLALVAQQLQAAFGIDFDPAWVMELESDAPHKFSRHLIIQIPGRAFANNLHVGAFVNDVCTTAVDSQSGISSLQVAKEGGTSAIVDTGVYTRNRAFRLYLSSKAGKSSILIPTGRFPNGAHSQKHIFMQSLICKVEPGVQLLHCFQGNELGQPKGRHSTSALQRSAAASQASTGPSPCPCLDRFVTSKCNQGGVQGSIRSWVLWDDIGVFLYNIKDNRWCGNIGRAHKSNGIYLIVDLQAGVWYQRCYDRECGNYRSETMPLPAELVRECSQAACQLLATESSNEGVLKDAEDIDEAAILAALEEYESAATR